MVWSTICLHHEQIMLKIYMLDLLILLDYNIILFFPAHLHLFFTYQEQNVHILLDSRIAFLL